MFFAANQYGPAVLNEAFNALPIDSATKLRKTARFFDVSERTLSDYLTGKRNPPRALVYAVWHESPIGRAVTGLHLFNEARTLSGLVRSLRETVTRQQQAIAALSAENAALKQARPGEFPANDPVYRCG